MQSNQGGDPGQAQHPQQGHPYPQHPHQAQHAAYPNHPQQHGHAPAPGATQALKSAEPLYEGVCKHTASLGGYLKWAFVSIVGGAIGWALGGVELFVGWPLWVLGLAGLPGMLWTFLKHVTTRYKVNTQRVEFERGVLSKTVDSLELWRVLDVRYKQTILDRILGNAAIVLIGTDQTDPEMVLYGLPNHRQLFERLRDAVQVARRSGRPMELVGGQEGFFEQVGGG
jgi:hypothetical protein